MHKKVKDNCLIITYNFIDLISIHLQICIWINDFVINDIADLLTNFITSGEICLNNFTSRFCVFQDFFQQVHALKRHIFFVCNCNILI